MSNPHKPRLVGRVPANRALTTRQTSASKLNDSFKYREAATYLMELPDPSHVQGARSSSGLPPKGDAGSGAANGQRVVNMGGSSADDDKGTKDPSNQRDVFYVVGFPLSTWSTSFQFFFLMGSIFFFFLIYGYCQELIFSFDDFKSYGWYLTFTQFGCYTIFGLLATQVQSDNKRRIPMKTYLLLSILTVTTMGMSNASLGYLNYPTQVIFKCCKLIPVMIGGVLIQGKPYGVTDACAAICMSIGLIFFTLADSTVSPKFDRTGIILISLALGADAVIGNVQEKAMKAHRASSSEVVLYSYSIGFVIIFIGLVAHGSFLEAFWFCYQNPVKTYVYAILFSLSGYMGIIFVLAMIRQFGALITVTDMCGRECSSSLASS
ncbi:adenosine 3'-phospho 5'-phosphosulfate transporter 2 isoform X2 [Strongylocentrotus purpuratus]|uniref:Adenosine 3'-phospho 5'-phosphosulfate transporter 2 n=1 Tax=Strongylocentrotus purpuratus TaxID=7668 RepID=A0A7M7NQ78_STRPU|nr:adenosine 3'-phospho 5'-phosphosulfate transporter 2 isoform X2 [Strongylocentrotus purpuratus]